jgi:hypothetical protein
MVVVITLGIVGQKAKARPVNNKSLTGFAGKSENIQAVMALVNTPKPTTLNPILTKQRKLVCNSRGPVFHHNSFYPLRMQWCLREDTLSSARLL